MLSVSFDAVLAERRPTGPMAKGITYMVRPAHGALEDLGGAAIRLVGTSGRGPASSRSDVQMKVRASVRGHRSDPCGGSGAGERCPG